MAIAGSSIPACFAATGWVTGILCLLYSSVVTYDTGLLLGKLCANLPPSRGCSFPALASEASGTLAARLGFTTTGQNRARKIGSAVIACLQYSCYYLTGVAELIYFEQYLGQMFSVSPLCQWQWLLIVGLLSLPVVQVPSFHATRCFALLFGVIPLAFNCLVFLYEIVLVQPWSCDPGPTTSLWPRATKELSPMWHAAVGLTAFAYAFGGHGLYPEQIRELAEPKRWHVVVWWTYAITVPLYWFCGIFGYAAYGNFALANINLNFPDNLMNKLSIGVQALQEFFFVLDSDLVVMLAIELAIGLDPSTCCAPSWRPSTWSRASRRGLVGSSSAASSSSLKSSARRCCFPAKATRYSPSNPSPPRLVWSPSPTSCRTPSIASSHRSR